MANLSCERVKDLLTDLHEGTLQQAARIPVESHLRDCEGCRSDLDGLALVYAAFKDAPEIDPPHNLRANVWSRIDLQEAEKSTARPAFSLKSLFMRPAFGLSAAALVLLVVGGLVVIPGRYQVSGVSGGGTPVETVVVSGPGTVLKPQADAVLVNSPTGQFVEVRLASPAIQAVTVEATLDGAMANGGTKVQVQVAGGASSVRIGPIVPLSNTSPVRAILKWSEGGTTHSMAALAKP